MKNKKDVPKEYLALIRHFPLRPIATEQEADQASELIGEILIKGLKCSKDERDYVDVLVLLLREYEAKHGKPFGKPMTPQRALESLMEDNSLSQSELARRIGIQQSVISEFLSGRRGISKNVIARLSEYFCIRPEYFMQKSKSKRVG